MDVQGAGGGQFVPTALTLRLCPECSNPVIEDENAWLHWTFIRHVATKGSSSDGEDERRPYCLQVWEDFKTPWRWLKCPSLTLPPM